jgi:hypothetical protein
MSQLRIKPLGALGGLGQNTESSQIDLPAEFATVAVNCFVNEHSRLSARKSMTAHTSTNTDLTATKDIERIYRHNKADASTIMVCSGNGRIFSATTTTLTSVSSGHSANLWQFASLNGKLFAAQVGHSLRWFNETTFAETTQATPSNPRAIHAAFGRLWALSADGSTLLWSDLLDGTNFTTGASGSLDLSKMHTVMRSPAIAVASFDRQIVVLCRDSIYLLGLSNDLNPNDVTTPIYLMAHVPGIGTIARDSVVATGEDLLFLADDGLRSLRRSVAEQQGPAPMTDVSALNTTALMRTVNNESNLAKIAAAWNPEEGWFSVFLPTAKEVWQFDLSQKVPQINVPRVCVWRMGARPVFHAVYYSDDTMFYAGTGYLFVNETYDATDDYTMLVETGWLSLESPTSLAHLKALGLNLRGGSGQLGTLRWYVDFDETRSRTRTFWLGSVTSSSEYNVAQYNINEFSTGSASGDFKINIGGTCKFVKFEIAFPVEGSEITLNNAQAYYNMGRLK